MDHNIAQWIIQSLWKISLQLAVLTCVIWLVARLSYKAPASLRYVLWLLVLSKVFIPPTLSFPNKLAFWDRLPAVVSIYGSVMPDAGGAVMPGQNGTPLPAQTPNESTRPGAPNYAGILALFWLAGISAGCVLLGARCLHQTKLTQRLGTVEPDVANLLAECAFSLGIRRLPRIGLSHDISAPMLIGVLRPVVVLPHGISETCSKSDLSAMLLHELAHIKRRDMIGVWLHQLAQALLFFHPAIWIAGRKLDRERELACDELVLASNKISREEYASGYLSAIKLSHGYRRASAALAMAEPFDIEAQRLRSILNKSIPSFSRGWIVAVLLIAIAGLPTFSAVGTANIDRSDRNASHNNRIGSERMLNTQKTISRSAAISNARDFLNNAGFRPGNALSAYQGTVKTPMASNEGEALSSNTARSAWIIKFNTRFDRDAIIWVDAENGQIIGGENLIIEEPRT